MTKDLVLINGTIYTLDHNQTTAEALVMRQGRIAYVGDNAGARSNARAGAEVIDLKGASVVPGLTDAHMHLESYALTFQRVNVEQPTRELALARVAEAAASRAKGSWILGRGWNHNAWDGQLPRAAWLDTVAPDHPVYLGAKSGHAAWCNSMALQLAGIDATTADPLGGQIVRDNGGNPTGCLLEEAMGLVGRIIPEATLDDVIAGMRDAMAEANRLGITMVHDMDGAMALRSEQVLRERGELTMRVLKAIPLDQLDEAIALGVRTGLGDEWLRIGQVKMFADGALGPRTAWMLDGYASAPKDTGIPTTPMEVIRESVIKANANGLGCAIHAIGDRACREVLDAYEAANTTGQMRNRVEHAQILHPADQLRFGRLGVIASMQPIHATSDMFISDAHLGERADRAYAFRNLLGSGAKLAFGSDCPVEIIDPRVGLHAAVTRRRADGAPGSDGWRPSQKLTVQEALEGFSSGAAFAAGMEESLGSLSVGKLADAVVFGADPFSVDPNELADMPVMATIVGGRLVWREASL